MPFKVKDPEFKNRIFSNVVEYEQARRISKKREEECGLRTICLSREPKELHIEAELKRNSTRLNDIESELRRLGSKMEEMLSSIYSSIKVLLINKDGIPYTTKLKGISTVKGEFPDGKDFELLVTTEGYEVGGQCFNSLSAAAEGVSKNRRNGWEWWKTEDGKTVGEAFRTQSQ